MKRNNLITSLNTQIAMIDAESIQQHINKGDLEDWLEDWRIEIAATSFGLYTDICMKEQKYYDAECMIQRLKGPTLAKSTTDRDKVISLLNALKISYEVNGGTIYIDPFYVDGASDAVIKFWDGEDFPDGQFHEFSVLPEQKMGRWLIKRVGDYDHAICSVCGDDSFLSPEWDAVELYKYCPNCGAKMEYTE